VTRVVFAVAIGVLLSSWTGRLLADDASCASAYEQGQMLRRRGRLVEAQRSFVTCSQSLCPAQMRSDCGDWLREVEQSTPSVAFEVRDRSGKDRLDVRVLADGAVLAEGLDGRALALDPGVHALRYELPRGGALEERLVVREGEKDRRVSVRFPEGSPAAPSPSPSPQSPSRPVMAYVLGAVGVVALGSFVSFGVSGYTRANDLAARCAPRCTESEARSVHTRYAIADVSLGIAVVSLGAALWLFLSAPAGRAPARAAQQR